MINTVRQGYFDRMIQIALKERKEKAAQRLNQFVELEPAMLDLIQNSHMVAKCKPNPISCLNIVCSDQRQGPAAAQRQIEEAQDADGGHAARVSGLAKPQNYKHDVRAAHQCSRCSCRRLHQDQTPIVTLAPDRRKCATSGALSSLFSINLTKALLINSLSFLTWD